MQVNKHVHAIRLPFSVMTPAGVVMDRFVTVYLIYGTNGICLIDTGTASSESVIYEYIRQTGRRPEDISLIIQTHAHPEHIGATRFIKAETRSPVAVHPSERSWIENVRLQAEERPVPGFDQLVAGSVAVDRLLEDSDVFDLGCGLKLQIFHVPGHSRGSIAILLLGYMVLFSGDAIPVPGDLPSYEDAAASVSSIRRLREIEGIRHLCPANDEPLAGDEGYRRIDESLEYLQRIHKAVLSEAGSLSSPDLMDLCRNVLAELGIPPEAANPITAKAFASHLLLRDKKRII